jgi:hypothetical protein
MPLLARTVPSEHQRLSAQALLRAGAAMIAVAVVANTIIWAISAAILQPPAEFQPLANPVLAIVFTVLYLIPAVLVYALVVRVAAAPLRRYRLIALVALLLSCIPNLMVVLDPSTAPMPGFTAERSLALAVMHIAAWACAITILPRLAPPPGSAFA